MLKNLKNCYGFIEVFFGTQGYVMTFTIAYVMIRNLILQIKYLRITEGCFHMIFIISTSRVLASLSQKYKNICVKRSVFFNI